MAAIHDPLFLGLDLSTQGLKGVLINEDSAVVHESAVNFDRDLPSYRTTNGAIRGPGGQVTSPVKMWLEAMDLLMHRMKQAGVEFDRIAAVSGDGQQHGSVYWSQDAEHALASLDATAPLTQLSPGAFSLPDAPIWQDSSTTRECRELEEAVGGPQALADLTGSRAYERFTGTQIKKIRRTDPEAYAATSRISLVSSWLPSLFLGKIAPIECSDASGMNLMDIITCKWDEALLLACGGPELAAKLGPEPVLGGTVLGNIASYWTERWGFNPECIVAPFTGDNPATVVSLSTPGDAILSLGTSTTLLLSIPPADTAPVRFTTSHLLSYPTTPDAHIAMLCYKNGALARDHIRDTYADGDWSKYNALVQQTPAGNDGKLGFYFPLPEIIPPNVQGEFFFAFDAAQPSTGAIARIDALPLTAHPRAILESQLLSIKSRIAAILPPSAPPLQRLIVTGGGSANAVIRQIAADIFGMHVFVADGGQQGAAAGGAVLAKFAWWRAMQGGRGTYEEMVAGQPERMREVAKPEKHELTALYESFVEPYRRCEDEVVRLCANFGSA
ncbi:actin-like ATPase domain-containing protein [Punctularia strigosozonata HHB-11173 SS5]|uniref:actin-like ATPase domain-containing protein n=1 Tax=Punctularia strigosozonata (strain HHB-11173) TaxID=741275 RepID=UPI0004416F3B|nr:actin-like ATPase domain-containing protein [Punctularia strigosozonata HHB-11173 SS5]EIN09559.1 actin-like ATPase domain-containing protein [Punctularia strigosozonata HHB-11173 SS5]